ncbi:unnamed protein product [Rotaria sp. Silwood1]|nr:unnamed protein product [Rotaria sp. Silwood1]CAF1562488.1 unnamed protein product [Rotaria sp. Silwood1]CAF1562876.1 unnamed protein product [Rotaria sp. Silwood1]CAF3683466.1 unnamed protein product [Rotaria sp. Silwood1]CAF4816610.1 unnamed protein product [Rotaria sp. Silwood1]
MIYDLIHCLILQHCHLTQGINEIRTYTELTSIKIPNLLPQQQASHDHEKSSVDFIYSGQCSPLAAIYSTNTYIFQSYVPHSSATTKKENMVNR